MQTDRKLRKSIAFILSIYKSKILQLWQHCNENKNGANKMVMQIEAWTGKLFCKEHKNIGVWIT